MKQTLFAIMAVTLVVGLTGCSACRRGFTGLMPGSCHDAPENCASCGDCGDCGDCGSGCGASCCGGTCGEVVCEGVACDVLHKAGNCCGTCKNCLAGLFGGCLARKHARPGPPTNIPYPYYTLRGPRDFLVDNPPSIGP